MSRRRTRHDVARPGPLATAAARALAEAEQHRDNAKAKLDALSRRVTLDGVAGFDMTEADLGVAELRKSLDAAEGRLTAARALVGTHDAA